MASASRSAPLPHRSGDPRIQEPVQWSRSLTQKILDSIEDAHRSCVHTETLKLNSSENARFATMGTTMGIPPAPVLKAVSENFTLESCLKLMHDGLQLHHRLLSTISSRLGEIDKLDALMFDLRDLIMQVVKMQKLIQKHAAAPPTSTSVELRLAGNFEVEVAAHLTLVQLQTFGQDVARCLRSLDQSADDETES